MALVTQPVEKVWLFILTFILIPQSSANSGAVGPDMIEPCARGLLLGGTCEERGYLSPCYRESSSLCSGVYLDLNDPYGWFMSANTHVMVFVGPPAPATWKHDQQCNITSSSKKSGLSGRAQKSSSICCEQVGS